MVSYLELFKNPEYFIFIKEDMVYINENRQLFLKCVESVIDLPMIQDPRWLKPIKDKKFHIKHLETIFIKYRTEIIQFQEEMLKKHELILFFTLLKELFNLNRKAHTDKKYFNKQKHFRYKSEFLDFLIFLTKDFNYEFIKIRQFNEQTSNYHNKIIYFIVNDRQISFHTDRDYNLQLFEGRWDGIINKKFPISKKEFQYSLKSNNINLKEHKQTNLICYKCFKLFYCDKKNREYDKIKKENLCPKFQEREKYIPTFLKKEKKTEIIIKNTNIKLRNMKNKPTTIDQYIQG